jgi:hypothetical protein
MVPLALYRTSRLNCGRHACVHGSSPSAVPRAQRFHRTQYKELCVPPEVDKLLNQFGGLPEPIIALPKLCSPMGCMVMQACIFGVRYPWPHHDPSEMFQDLMACTLGSYPSRLPMLDWVLLCCFLASVLPSLPC